MEAIYRSFARSGDYASQRKLFALSFPETLGTPVNTDAHYAWKFESFPGPVSAYEYVASEPEELTGYYAAIPYEYSVDGKVLRCGMVCDVMTHPERRGQGIFTKLGRYATGQLAEEGLAFTTGYPIRPEVIPGHLKVGWKVVHELPMYLHPVGVGSLLPSALRFVSVFADPLLRLLQRVLVRADRDYRVTVLSRDEFIGGVASGVAYAEFLATWLSESRNALVKSPAFLAWRTAAPETDYRFLLLRNKDRLVGLALARPTNLKGVESLAVLDFMILEEHLRGAGTLHAALGRLAESLGKDVVVCMSSPYWARRYRFARYLYVRTPAVFSLIVKKLDAGIPDEKLFAENRWHLFWIDSDDL